MRGTGTLSFSTLILRLDEIWLKSPPTRRRMLSLLEGNIERFLTREGISYRLTRGRGRIYIEVEPDRSDEAADILSRVFGVSSLSPAAVVDKRTEAIRQAVIEAASMVDGTFAVRVNRSDKSFPMTSPELERWLGAEVVKSTGMSVDLTSPDVTIGVEVSDRVYIFTETIRGPGGLPYSSQGKVLSLLSGGIDSPVASWLVARRGAGTDFLMVSPGLVDAEKVVRDIWKYLVDRWGMVGSLYVARASDAFLEISSKVREGLRQIVFKRFIYRVGERIARESGALALVTGESLGQVSSQTLKNLSVIEEAVRVSVLRPLVGMNKVDIVRMAEEIGTFDLSLKGRDYCLLERHSNASGDLVEVLREEERLSADPDRLEILQFDPE